MTRSLIFEQPLGELRRLTTMVLKLYWFGRPFEDAIVGLIIGTGIVTDRMAISIILFSNVCQGISSTGSGNMNPLLALGSC
jgi:hypothetical protein